MTPSRLQLSREDREDAALLRAITRAKPMSMPWVICMSETQQQARTARHIGCIAAFPSVVHAALFLKTMAVAVAQQQVSSVLWLVHADKCFVERITLDTVADLDAFVRRIS